MLSLIVALEASELPDREYRFALSHFATPGLQRWRDDNSADDATVEHGSALLALLPHSDEVVAVVPARMLSWHQMVLPRVNRARLRQALEGLLEERLLDDPRSLHFALAPGAAAGDKVWVVACNRAWLRDTLQAFESQGRRVSRVVPAYVPLPAGSDAILNAVGTLDNAWLVRCADDGVQTLPLGPATQVVLNLGGAAVLTTAEPAVAELAEQMLGGPVRVQRMAQGLVDAAKSGWDMAQFELTSTTGTRAARRAQLVWAQWSTSAGWRPARWGLAALLLAHLLGLNVWAWKERSALQSKRTEVRSLLTQTFPKIVFVVNASVQMEREVEALRLAAGALSRRDFEPMLAAVAENIPMTRTATYVGFSNHELTLKGLQLTAPEAGTLTRELMAAGYNSRVDSDAWVIRLEGKASTVRGTQP